VSARPFVKRVGGKTALLPELLKRVPPSFRRYHEPFCGGAAFFFALQPTDAFLGDADKRLIRTYRAIRNNVDELIRVLQEEYVPQHSEQFFYAVRAVDPDPCSDTAVAAWSIYLNKTCFNGLTRVNRAGKFNVPFGRYANPTICDEANLRACSTALHFASLRDEDFRESARAQEGDFWYADCPYVPLSATSNFTGYTVDGFTMKDQTDLRDLALTLKRRGVHVMLSNSGSTLIEQLYSKDFKIEEVKCRRNINSKGDKRGEITEYIIT
jgi:DNA adenine methylase